MSRTLRFSLIRTMPIMLGYLFMGGAFGLMVQHAGYNFIWSFFIGLFVYTGSGQYLMVSMLDGGVSFLSVFIMQLSVNSRHMFYGLSFLEKFKRMGKAYPYMIFSLTDETYSLLCYTKIPRQLNENRTIFTMALLDHCYWITGCTLGAILGEFNLMDITGVDFAMTALFTVIFVEQWYTYKNHIPVIIGFASGIVSLIIFGPKNFILPALLVAVGLLVMLKDKIKMNEDNVEENRNVSTNN